MTVKILYGLDTERPFGKFAEGEEGRIEREGNLELIGRLNNLMDRHDAGRTFFVLGGFLDLCAHQLGSDYLRQVFSPENHLVEIAQHTYGHPVISPIPTRPDKAPISVDELRTELETADNALRGILGLDNIVGFRTPLGYAGGLTQHLEVLDVLKEAGFLYVSSNLRNQDGGINAPLVENGQTRQPLIYKNGLVETPTHGWHDSAFTGTSRTKGTEGYPTTPDGIFEHYSSLFVQAKDISEETGNVIYIGLVMHPWAIKKYDSNLTVLTRLLEFSGENSFETITHKQAADEVLNSSK